MKSTTQTRPRKSSRLTRLPERSVSVNGGTTPYVPRASSVASEAAGEARCTHQIAAAPTISAWRAITPARSKAVRRRLAISERPVDERVMEAGDEEHDGGAEGDSLHVKPLDRGLASACRGTSLRSPAAPPAVTFPRPACVSRHA